MLPSSSILRAGWSSFAVNPSDRNLPVEPCLVQALTQYGLPSIVHSPFRCGCCSVSSVLVPREKAKKSGKGVTR